ncbi:hypothetical protein [Carnobacterium maltaromaticum]
MNILVIALLVLLSITNYYLAKKLGEINWKYLLISTISVIIIIYSIEL